MDFSKFLHGFVKVVLCISRPLPKNQAEVWPTFQNLLKLLFWTNGVEWVKAFGPCAFGNVSFSIFCSLQMLKFLQSHKKKKLVWKWHRGGWKMLYGCMLPNLCEGELKCNTNLFPAFLHHSSLCNLFPTKTRQQYKSWANQAFLCRLFIVCHDWPCKRLMHYHCLHWMFLLVCDSEDFLVIVLVSLNS